MNTNDSARSPKPIDPDKINYIPGVCQFEKGSSIPMPKMHSMADVNRRNKQAPATGFLAFIVSFVLMFFLFVAVGVGLSLVVTVLVSTGIGIGVWKASRHPAS